MALQYNLDTIKTRTAPDKVETKQAVNQVTMTLENAFRLAETLERMVLADERAQTKLAIKSVIDVITYELDKASERLKTIKKNCDE